jgi:hypothetical protein
MTLLVKSSLIAFSATVASLCGAAALAAPPTAKVDAFIVNDSVPVEATIVNGPVPVQDVGDATRHVFLDWNPSGGLTCGGGGWFFRVNEYGDNAITEFEVPAGHVLNITDISWSAYITSAPGFTAGSSLVFSLGIHGGWQVYRSSPVLVTDTNRRAMLGGNESLNAGINIGGGMKLCEGLVEYGTDQISRAPRVVHLRGVLLPAPSR